MTRQSNTGRLIDRNGYVRIRLAPGKWAYEHRVVWEQSHGPVPVGFHIHHRNGDKTDNALTNLQLMSNADHNRDHTTERHRSGQLNNRGAHSARYRRELDDEEIVRRRGSGESFRSIGRDLGVAHNVIANHYRRAMEVA